MSGAARRRGQQRGRGEDLDNAGQGGQRGRGASRGSRGRGSRGRGNLPANVDGPASRGTGSNVGSQASRIPSGPSQRPPSQQGRTQHLTQSGAPPTQAGQPASRRSSIASQPPQQPQSAPAVGLDPAREKPPRATDTVRNIDLPASFYNIDGVLPTEFTRRPGFNSTGKTINLPINAYRVNQFPTKTIYQYDVMIGNGAEKRMVIEKVWRSQARLKLTGPPVIFDGNKLAWSLDDYGAECRAMVDLDAEQGRPASDKNTFRLQLRRTKKLDLSVLTSYLTGKVQQNEDILQALNFMDHLLREGPSQNSQLISVKRSFFSRSGERADLGSGIEVFRGVYQSMRLAQGSKLIINVDVANTCFWKPGMLVNLIIQKNRYRDAGELLRALENKTVASATEKYLKKLTVKAVYQGNKMPNREWKIKKMSPLTANTHKIAWRDPQTGQETGERVSITAYFRRRYNVQLRNADLPLLEMTKKEVLFPMELLTVIENQRYGAKLDELQTANMIKFAVSPPGVRSQAINEGKGWLNWTSDQYLQNYGLQIEPNQIVTQARILPPPGIKFGNKVEQPGTKGRWDLRGKTFLSPNSKAQSPEGLKYWGIGVFPGRIQLGQQQLEKFALDFAKAYRSHGGTVANGLPHIMPLTGRDTGVSVEQLWTATGNKFQHKPEFLIFIVQNKDAFHYLRIKKSADCRYGVVSQVMQAQQVQKGNPQYYSNVLMKVNAKLGGCTSQVLPNQASGFQKFSKPTMIIGADVSHASPGSQQPSMAAITMSLDRHAGRYAAACQTNGFRVEMIRDKNWSTMLGPLVQHWASNLNNGRLPEHIFYMRDGVSEGEFAHVLGEEVPSIKRIMLQLANGAGWNGKITTIVASKRHHIRAFPRQGDGDQKGNPLPGTLVERDVTMPNEFDFYLYSHIALQGTSRPVHYTVLKDEAGMTVDQIQDMIYDHCYQYIRSTTSVSLHPAVYYAHLASNRAKAHENLPASAGPQGGPGYKQNQPVSEEPTSSEAPPLLKMEPAMNIQFNMWYI